MIFRPRHIRVNQERSVSKKDASREELRPRTLYAKTRGLREGQSFLEFTFSYVLVMFLLMGLVKVFLWTGSDLVRRREAHESVLMDQTCMTTGHNELCGLLQLRPTFFTVDDLKVAINSDLL